MVSMNMKVRTSILLISLQVSLIAGDVLEMRKQPQTKDPHSMGRKSNTEPSDGNTNKHHSAYDKPEPPKYDKMPPKVHSASHQTTQSNLQDQINQANSRHTDHPNSQDQINQPNSHHTHQSNSHHTNQPISQDQINQPNSHHTNQLGSQDQINQQDLNLQSESPQSQIPQNEKGDIRNDNSINANIPLASESAINDEANKPKVYETKDVIQEENIRPASESDIDDEANVPPASESGINDNANVPPASENGINDNANVPPASESGINDQANVPPASENGINDNDNVPPASESGINDQANVPPVLESADQPEEHEIFALPDEDEGEVKVDVPKQRQLTPEESEAQDLFEAGEKLINATYYKEYREAYLNFAEASKLGHQKAKEYVAFGYLFGDYLPQNVTKASEMFEELAVTGSPKAQMGLAFMYGAGFHFNSSQAKALIFSTFGALGGDPLAQMALGYRYYAGVGVESTCETALTYYRKVATKVADSVTLAGGPVVQRVRLQDEMDNAGTNNSPLLDDDLLQYYHFLADKGDMQAQVVLGTLYYQGGKGVQINHEQAYHYFTTAAESGSGHAMGYLGKMHSEGSPHVKQDNITAFEYFKKSAEKHNHIGQSGLGMIYLNGLGVEKDVTKAFRYFSLASDQGSVDAQLQLGIMYFSGNGVRPDYKLAVKYFTMASQNGHVLAFYNLAQMHATGTGVLRNCHTAVELFKNVAERGKWSDMLMDAHRMYHDGSVTSALIKYMFLADLGYEVAQSNVAFLLDTGASLKFNSHESHQRALLQYSRAASQGSTHARLKVGDYHYYGLGTDVDYESAASHYRMASEQQNNAQAMFNLGYMHEQGLGLKQDVHLAKRFYDMAADTSLDAHVPVTLALLKLGLLYGVDVFNKEFEGLSSILEFLNPAIHLGPGWDLYLASVLAALLATIYLARRLR